LRPRSLLNSADSPDWSASLVGLVRLLALAAIASSAQLARAADPATAPGLDQLLKLPSSAEFSAEKKGSATRNEWRQRFHEARTSAKSAEVAVKKAQDELAEVAGSKDDWQFTPPGLPAESNADATSSFQLRQELKRQRGELERSKARLRELEVEANLAGVPEDWRDPSTEARSGHDSVTQSTSPP
jgi:hypothetical protein